MAMKPKSGYKLKADEEAILVEGLADLQIAFKAIGVPVDAIKAANKESGQAVAVEARKQVPVRSGALRKTIRLSNATTHIKIFAGTAKRVPYANPIHWGWFYDRKRGFARNIKPNPFLARALGYTRDEIIKTYTEQMAKLIAKYEPPKGRR